MKTRTHDLTAGSIPQHMLRLAAPLILGNILQQLYNAVDAFILGRCAGGLEFAAVGIAGSVMNLFLFMITGACTGVSVIFAQLFGANDLETFRREHFLSLVFGLLCTLACSAIGFLCLPLHRPLLRSLPRHRGAGPAGQQQPAHARRERAHGRLLHHELPRGRF